MADNLCFHCDCELDDMNCSADPDGVCNICYDEHAAKRVLSDRRVEEDRLWREAVRDGLIREPKAATK